MEAAWVTMGAVAVLFVATFIRSAFGFGEALVAVPLLALMMPVEVAAPVAVLVSIVVAAVVVVQDRRHVHFRSAAWLVLFTLPGVPVGLLVLKTAPEALIKGLLAGVIFTFSIYSLLGRPRRLENDRSAGLFGFTAGVLGGAYGMNGPPLVIYGTMRQWSPGHFRATLQGYFLPASFVGMMGYGMAGLWTAPVNWYFLWALPAVVPAILLGRALNRRMKPERFLAWVHVGLMLIAVVLLVQAVGGGGGG